MTQDVKAQHTPSDAAKRKRYELAKQHWHSYRTIADATAVAFDLYIDEVDRVAREMADCPNATVKSFDFLLRSLMLPDPVDPLEEIFKVVSGRDCREGEEWSQAICRCFRAELDKRGLTIAPKEQGRLTDAK